MAMVESTSSLPGQLREHGAVSVPYEKLAALIGLVFLQKTALNLQVGFYTAHCFLQTTACSAVFPVSANQAMACCTQGMP